MHADMIVTGAKVLTMNEAMPRAEAVAVADGKIVAVGTVADVDAWRGPATQVIEAAGRTLLPGFIESHMHLMGGVELNHLQLTGVHGVEALTEAFRRYAEDRPGMLMAEGADYSLIPGGITRHDLDKIIADRPIAIRSMDHHTVWANTMALREAGLLRGAAMPHGHEVKMGPDDLATGELLEFEAFDPILALAGVSRMYIGISKGAEPATWPTDAERAVDKDHIARGLAHCAKHGFTSLVSMDGNRYTLALLRELQSEGRLTQRVKVPFHMKPEMELSELDRASAMTAEFNDEWITSGFVKMFMDGVVDSRTAFMLQDYPGTIGHRSAPLFDPERFKVICTEIDRRGLQIAVHAIGDGAVRTTIDGYDAAAQANGLNDRRHRIEHIELIDRSDIPRLAELEIIASLQPPHPPGAMDFPIEAMAAVFSPERWRDAYLCRTLKDAGATVAFASDWPVADVSALRSLQANLTRPTYEGGTPQGLSLMAALRAYTAGGAFAAHMEGLTGQLRVGMAGDLVLINGDIEAIAFENLGQTGIALTVAGGRIIHQVPEIA